MGVHDSELRFYLLKNFKIDSSVLETEVTFVHIL